MSQNIDHIATLIVKHIQGLHSAEEAEELNRWAKSDPRNALLLEDLLHSSNIRQRVSILKDFDTDVAWQKLVDQGVVQSTKKKRIPWKSMISAAALLLFVGLWIQHWRDREPTPRETAKHRVVDIVHPKYKNDVLPAVEGATLITASGETITLSETIKVQDDGSVLNESENTITRLEENVPVYNEIVVPQTNYYSFQLSDGTKVWINANSRLSFPSKFMGLERKVRLIEGEAYFEVAKKQNQPFIVETTKASVRVLGTCFNVRNYKNTFTTTLAEGSVEVFNEKDLQKLRPHQKAFFSSENLIVASANLTKELSWKNNVFYFKNDNLRNVMMQIENWYGVNVLLDKALANNATYSGEIKRDVTLTQMLDMLEFTSGLEFSLNGTVLHIKPKKV